MLSRMRREMAADAPAVDGSSIDTLILLDREVGNPNPTQNLWKTYFLGEQCRGVDAAAVLIP